MYNTKHEAISLWMRLEERKKSKNKNRIHIFQTRTFSAVRRQVLFEF